ncbi:hypothetical protein HDU96_007061 [Phlyctochytrium bullatum]|nr:hypothetical protein HDU96_007061 [Phlyctochytrium bullatum]
MASNRESTASSSVTPFVPVGLPPLYAPYRFGFVKEDLFRGGFPKERNYRFLKRLRLNTILSLTPNINFASLQAFCEQNDISHIHFFVEKPKDDEPPLTFTQAAQILQLMTDATKLPMYVHCLDGTVVTGVMIMLLRRLQMWSIPWAISERGRYLGGDGTVAAEEVEFVERFSGEFELANPLAIPRWLWGGQITFKKHPTMRVKLPPPMPISGNSSVSSVVPATPTQGPGGEPLRLLDRTAVVEPGTMDAYHNQFQGPVDLMGRQSITSNYLSRFSQTASGGPGGAAASGVGIQPDSEHSVRRRVVEVLQGRSSLAGEVPAIPILDRKTREAIRRNHASGELSQMLEALALEI